MGVSAKCTTIRHIVRLRQMLRRWRIRACTGGSRLAPSDVPEGHFAVRVGSQSRRFVVRTSYLNHPIFKKLLLESEEMYGYDHSGPIAIPCDEKTFMEILGFLAGESVGGGGGGCGNVGGVRETWCYESFSVPLLRGFEVEHSPVVPINV
ncbi:SAUR-like auxin-responsive protein family [Zostera marina]|uniref:SAUR-like auxin-responsive protein family n=1 Tax=Zostera marina TaxID=29655 RepID=A0A0K9P0R9_ZOSMR|nr:SAUR-like auxin-responsive protein family [Zostera marina]